MRTGRIIGPTSNAEGVADPSTTPSISLVEVIPALLADREGVPKDDPWPFLDPYGYSQGKLLFGRQHERDAIKRTLSTLHAGVFVIHGASGTGKSSLVNAVIVNELVALGFRVFVDQIFKRRLVAPTNTFTEWKRIATRGEKVAIILDQFEELFVLNEKRLISEFMASMAEIVGKLSLPLIIGVRREFYSDVVGDRKSV